MGAEDGSEDPIRRCEVDIADSLAFSNPGSKSLEWRRATPHEGTSLCVLTQNVFEV